MRFNNKNSLVVILVLLLLVGCHSSKKYTFGKVYYKNNESQWLAAMARLGYKKKSLRDHILLILSTTECAPCLKELAWWNSYGSKQTKAGISLILLTKYKATFNAFLKANHINLSSYQDFSTILLKKGLIPTTPIKIYFNKKGNIKLMYYIGEKGDIGKFLREINQ